MMATSNILLKNLIILSGMMAVLVGCRPGEIPPNDDPATDPTKGILIVDFNLPRYHHLPEKRVHRANLCLSHTADSLYRGLFVDCANVSDMQKSYTFTLHPGTYYYQAGLTCSALGDSCLWGGFPGGRMGLRWAIEKVVIEKGKTTNSVPDFQ